LKNLSALLIAGASLVLLIPLWGISGAAVAVLITSTLTAAFPLAWTARILRIHSYPMRTFAPVILTFVLLGIINVVIAVRFDTDLARLTIGSVGSAVISGCLVLHILGHHGGVV
jgi:O-antigen/teichoic acid export membrane protein